MVYNDNIIIIFQTKSDGGKEKTKGPVKYIKYPMRLLVIFTTALIET